MLEILFQGKTKDSIWCEYVVDSDDIRTLIATSVAANRFAIQVSQKPISCIYAITNLKDGKRYIGSAKNFEARRSIHISMLKGGKHPNAHLQRAWNRDGAENFAFIIVSILNLDSDLIPAEQAWIDGFEPEYNIARVAGNTLGCKRTEDAKRRISEFHTGNKYCVGREISEDTRKKISKANIGRKLSEEEKSNHRKIWIEKSPEDQEIALRNLSLGRKPGWHHSDETKEVISRKNKGKPGWSKGIPMTEAAKKNLSIKHTGKKLSDETKNKIGVAHKEISKSRTRNSRGRFSKEP